MSVPKFSERQQFRQGWLWALIVMVTVYAMYDISKSATGVDWKNVLIFEIVFPVVLLTLVIVLLYIIRLDTNISEDGIRYKFFPFQQAYRHIRWEEISRSYIRAYKPILDYGGWGLRLGIFGKGKAVNISGHIGLQLELKNGKKLLIGTQKGEEIDTLLHLLNVPGENT